MKCTKYIILAGAALALAACSAADEQFQTFDAPVAAIVVGGIDDGWSRAANASWEPGDQIGISTTSNGKTQYANMKYQTSGTGDFTHVGGAATGIFFQDTEEDVVFSAYYPFYGTERISAGTIRGVRTDDQSGQKQFDYLFARSEVASHAKPDVNLHFSHMMSCIVLNINADSSTGLTIDDVQQGSYSLSGISLTGDFNTVTGNAEASGKTTDDWTINATPTDNGNGLSYRLIVFPQFISKLTFKAIIKGNTYAGVFKNLSLIAGTSCAFDITIKKTGLFISNKNLGIIDMTEGGPGSGSATVDVPFNGHEAVLMREATADQPALYIATCNIGANSPEDAGLYFWWGDIIGHSVDKNHTTRFEFAEDNEEIVTAKKTINKLKSEGYIDNNNNLIPSMDAARHHWGGNWRMPTREDIEWLLATDNCDWPDVPDATGGVYVQSKSTGGKIYLPATGLCSGNTRNKYGEIGCYWLSTGSNSNIGENFTCGVYLMLNPTMLIVANPHVGMSVRPVSN